jgi:hypothetical protein
MNKKDIIKLLKLLKKDKKKNKKLKKIKKLIKPAASSLAGKQPYENIATLKAPIITTGAYERSFEVPKFADVNRVESQQFSEYKKTRGLLPTESRSGAPSELDLFKEYEKVKKLSKSDIQDLLTDKNVKSQALERQKYLDSLKIAEEKRIQKEQKELLKQELKTKKKIEGIRKPPIMTNKIIPDSGLKGYSTEDNLGLETAIGGTSDEFIVNLPPEEAKVEGPSLITVGTKANPNVKVKRAYNRKTKLIE